MKMKKRFLFGTLLLTVLLLLTSCYTPSPLYGTWTDNNGDKIVFFDDGSFMATVVDAEQNTIDYEGTYACIDNVLVFNVKADSSYLINTEWDIRGALLYLTWTEGGKTVNLTLYHTAR